ncbi:MAG: KH domain-containing protein [archaeon]
MPEFLSIPKDRVAVLVGIEGKTKARVEKACDVTLEISKDGQVSVFGNAGGDPLKAYLARDLVKAIGRGFSPDRALFLLEEGVEFVLIDLGDYAPNSKAIRRLKARVIGAGGRCKRFFEETLGIYISVYGDTVGLIGPENDVAIARQGLEKLFSGAMHATVYKFVERKKTDGAGLTGGTEWWQTEKT